MKSPDDFRWGKTVAPAHNTLFDAVQSRAHAYPKSIAVIEEDYKISYESLISKATAYANGIVAQDLLNGPPIIAALHRSADQVAFFLACSLLGLDVVPVDPQHPAARLDRIAAILGSHHLVHSEFFNTSNAPQKCTPVALTSFERFADHRKPFPQASRPAHFIFFTSGSSGEPKGVRTDQTAILNALHWRARQFSVTVSDRTLYKQNVMIDTSLWEIFLPLITGGTLIVVRPLGQVNFDYLAQIVARHDVTLIQFVGSLLRQAMAHPTLLSNQTLRALFCGGESWSSDIAQQIRARFPNLTLFNVYGQTETGLGILSADVTSIGAEDLMWLEDIADNTGILLDDAGEMLVAGPQLLQGYANRPSPLEIVETKTGRFLAYRTGDFFSRDATGRWQFQGRKDSEIKMQGLRFNLEEVEQIASKLVGTASLAELAEGPDSPFVRLYLVTPPEGTTVAEIRMKLRKYLPPNVLPKEIDFVPSIPTTEQGKIDRRGFLLQQKQGKN